MLLPIPVAPFGPADGQFHGFARTGAVGGMLGALVAGHDDGGAQCDLRRRSALGRKEMERAVEWRAELDAFFAELAHLAQAPDLEAAGVGEDGAIPAHEPVQPPKRADGFGTWPQIEVIVVAEQ